MLSCMDLVKICNAQIDFSKNKDYKSMSEDEFIRCLTSKTVDFSHQIQKL